jgi:iron-sulfur cluster assembly protein/iron-sulfur cluster insertion protein
MCFIDATESEEKERVGFLASELSDVGAKFAAAPFDSGLPNLTLLLTMITLTARAAKQVKSMHTEQGVPEKRLRVLVESGGCSGFQYGMSFDLPKQDDSQLESEGVPFVIDPASLAYLQGSLIDFDDGLHGKGFEIKNPNAQSTCGCGKSFS